jgi:hypothetical protein
MVLTELDTEIASLLVGDKRALSALSRVSKYYRAVAEPFLSKDMILAKYDYVSLRHLLLTIPSRPDAALYVKSFAIRDRTSPGPNPLGNLFNDNLYQRMQAKPDMVRTKIGNLLRPY